LSSLGKAIILLGVLLIVVGGVLLVASRVPFLGKLPGDIHIKHRNFNLYFPVTTCILLSIALTIIFNLFFRR